MKLTGPVSRVNDKLKLVGHGRSLRAAFSLNNDQPLIYGRYRKVFSLSVGPLDFQFVNPGRLAQTEMQRHVILGTINSSTYNIASLAQISCAQVGNAADRVSRTLPCNVTDKL